MDLKEISRSRFKQYKSCLRGDFWVYLGGDSFSQRIGKIKRNKKFGRLNVALKLEFEVKISRRTPEPDSPLPTWGVLAWG